MNNFFEKIFKKKKYRKQIIFLGLGWDLKFIPISVGNGRFGGGWDLVASMRYSNSHLVIEFLVVGARIFAIKKDTNLTLSEKIFTVIPERVNIYSFCKT